MRTLTNNLGLPEPLVRAIQNDTYDYEKVGDYSCTQIIKPARVVALQGRCRDKIVEDAADKLWALFGQIGHKIIEQAAMPDEVVEKRLYAKSAGKTISGRFDLYQGHAIWDYKFCKVGAIRFGPKMDWIQQGNVLRWLCAKNGIAIEKIQFLALLRDWDAVSADNRKDGYPDKGAVVIDIPIWSIEKTEEFVESRVKAHEAAKLDLPECTDEERWCRNKWAAMKPGGKKAVKLYGTEEAAAAHANSIENGFVEPRPGMSMRCRYYCSVLPFCSQGRDLIQP